MPIMFSFDLGDTEPVHYNRLQSMFERLHWQRLGGSCYRFPSVGRHNTPEDWLNYVVPALMMFRNYTLQHNVHVQRFSLDANASTGYSHSPAFGSRMRRHPPLATPVGQAFARGHLRNWLADATTPYEPQE
jgi:hypothetical protein